MFFLFSIFNNFIRFTVKAINLWFSLHLKNRVDLELSPWKMCFSIIFLRNPPKSSLHQTLNKKFIISIPNKISIFLFIFQRTSLSKSQKIKFLVDKVHHEQKFFEIAHLLIIHSHLLLKIDNTLFIWLPFDWYLRRSLFFLDIFFFLNHFIMNLCLNFWL